LTKWQPMKLPMVALAEVPEALSSPVLIIVCEFCVNCRLQPVKIVDNMLRRYRDNYKNLGAISNCKLSIALFFNIDGQVPLFVNLKCATFL